MEIKYSKNTVESINELFSSTEHWGDMRSYGAMITPVVDNTFCWVISTVTGILFYIGMLINVDWVEHFSLGILIIFAAMVVAGVVALTYLWAVEEYTDNNPKYKKYLQWEHFTELVDEVREACITQEFLKRSNVKTVRCTDDGCELIISGEVDDVVKVYTEYSIPKSIRENLFESGVLDFTNIDCIVEGLKDIQRGLR